MNNRDFKRAKHAARLAKLPPKSGHAKVLRARLGLDAPEAPEAPVAVVAVATPEPVVEEEAPKAKKKRKK